MAELKVGTVTHWTRLSPVLAVFRMRSQDGARFPGYKAGQYIALRRDDCRLTRKVVDEHGKVHYVPDLDELGRHRVGSVTHSYSISSAPFETERQGHLEFYVVLDAVGSEYPGRLTESLFRLDPEADNQVAYVDRIVGDFTLEKRAAGFASVLLVGTGTGLAPFASMIKQLHHEAEDGRGGDVRYTLLHANRTRHELAYHQELQAIERAGRFDFVYLPSVSRPTTRDAADAQLGVGRANNLLRHVFGLPLKEEEDFATARVGGDVDAARRALGRTVRPGLPRHIAGEALRQRIEPSRTVALTCGNALSMADIKHVADAVGMRFEKEDWKFSMATKT